MDVLNGIPCTPNTPTIACVMGAIHCLVECYNSQTITGINHTMEIIIDCNTLVWMKFQPAYGFVFNGSAWEKDDVFPRRIGNKLEVIPRPGFVWVINKEKTSAYLFKTNGSMPGPKPTTATIEISSTPATSTTTKTTKWVWMLVGSVSVLIIIVVGVLIWKTCKSTKGGREEEINRGKTYMNIWTNEWNVETSF